MEFFKDIGKIKYEGKSAKSPLAFRYYNPDEIIGGKTMREQLRFGMSYWHTMCAEGADMFGVGTIAKSYGASEPMEIARNKAYAAFELMNKLDIDYFCFHDRDIAPEGDSLRESNARLDAITDLLEELMAKYNKKVLWGTANCFGNKRYMHGAGTAPNADVFAFAAAQIKKAVEITTRLNGEGYVFWGGREGYETLLNTDLALEQDNMARLMRLTVDYARSIGFKGDFYIEPKPKEPTKHQYDFDVSTVLAFLRKYGLERDFKMNIEANHATLAGHTFQHDLRISAINGMLGSIDANQGDLLLGWDTDEFPFDVYTATMCMYEVIKAGGLTGGFNFDAKNRRPSYTEQDMFEGYILGMDTFALGLIKAAELIEDGRIDAFVEQRYASYLNSEIGMKIIADATSLEELAAYADALGAPEMPGSGKQEALQSIVNSVLFR